MQYEDCHQLLQDADTGVVGHFISTPASTLHQQKARKSYAFYLGLLVLILVSTNLASWNMAKRLSERNGSPVFQLKSRYASLSPHQVEPFNIESPPYASTSNDTATFNLWQSIRTETGAIAVPDSVSDSWNLPPSQRFPWDQSKGLFQVHGFHSLHCVKNVAITLYQLKYGLPLSRHWDHVMHCVDTLRRDIMCYADDTPRYTSRTGKGIGPGQTRHCRDWGELENWAKGFDSCYGGTNGQPQPLIEHFKYCPSDSPYRDQVERIWGKEAIAELDRP